MGRLRFCGSSDVFSWNCRKWDRWCIGKEGSAKAPVRLEPIIKVTQEHVKTCIKKMYSRSVLAVGERWWIFSGSTGTSIQDAPDGCLVYELGVGVDLLRGHRVLKEFRKILGARSVARKRLSLGLCWTCVKVQALCELLLVNGAQRVNQF